jgi:hypothetical protein
MRDIKEYKRVQNLVNRNPPKLKDSVQHDLVPIMIFIHDGANVGCAVYDVYSYYEKAYILVTMFQVISGDNVSHIFAQSFDDYYEALTEAAQASEECYHYFFGHKGLN